MIDDPIYDMLNYVVSRRTEAQVELDDDMPTVAEKLGYGYEWDRRSFYHADTKNIHVRGSKDENKARSDAAHELSHALALEGDPCYDSVLRYRYAHAANLVLLLERLMDHSGDLLHMPDELVTKVLEMSETRAEAVWVLHQVAKAPVPDALRRLVHFNLDAKVGGFIGVNGMIRHAHSYRWHMPCWIGDAVPSAYDGFCGDGVSLFAVPGWRDMVIGLIVIDEG